MTDKNFLDFTFLGSGSAFVNDGKNYQSNMLFEKKDSHGNKRRMLLDCGGDARFALKEVTGLAAKDIEAVYISHLHADHIGGLEWLGFSTYFDPSCGKPTLFISQSLVDPLWESLKGGMRSLQGEIATLNTFFNVCQIENNGSFLWQGIKFQLIQTIHVLDAFSFMPSYGLIFEVGGKTIFVTTDTQFCPHQITDFYDKSDIIFHDCETTPFKSGVHANFQDMKTLPDETKKKMWLYHHQGGDLPDAKKAGFRGFVDRGDKWLFYKDEIVCVKEQKTKKTT